MYSVSRPLPLCCDFCGEPLEDGDRFYLLPDGFALCWRSDCLALWLSSYEHFPCLTD